MDANDMGADLKEVLISEEQLRARIAELAARIDVDYAGRELLLVGVLKGAVMVMADLARAMHSPVLMDWMAVSSYGSGTKSSGVVRILKDLDTDITGRNVLVVEDIIDSGLTLSWLVGNLRSRGPASVEVCVMLRKPAAARMDVNVGTSASISPTSSSSVTGSTTVKDSGTFRSSGSSRRTFTAARGTHSPWETLSSTERRATTVRRSALGAAGRWRGVPSSIPASRQEREGSGHGAGTQGSPAGDRRDMMLVRRVRPRARMVLRVVHRWI